MYDIPQYEVGDLFNNMDEVSYNAIKVEVMARWVDEDAEMYYIIKCREITHERRTSKGAFTPGYFPWMLVDDVDMVDGFRLYKYFEKEN